MTLSLMLLGLLAQFEPGFPVSPPSAVRQSLPSAAFDGTKHLVTWLEGSGLGVQQVRGRILLASGQWQGPDFLLGQAGSAFERPRLAPIPGGGFFVAWGGTTVLEFVLIRSTGAQVAGTVAVSAEIGGVACFADLCAIVFDAAGTRAALVDVALGQATIGPLLQTNNTVLGDVGIVAKDTTFVASWMVAVPGSPTYDFAPTAYEFSRAGALVGVKQQLGPAFHRYPVNIALGASPSGQQAVWFAPDVGQVQLRSRWFSSVSAITADASVVVDSAVDQNGYQTVETVAPHQGSWMVLTSEANLATASTQLSWRLLDAAGTSVGPRQVLRDDPILRDRAVGSLSGVAPTLIAVAQQKFDAGTTRIWVFPWSSDGGAVADAGTPIDAGMRVDAGAVDAGGVDAGGVDAGGVDAGGVDAGGVDAGGVDAGVDAGVVDAGVIDAGRPDAADGGTMPIGGTGCGCSQSSSPAGVLLLGAAALLLTRTRRRTRR